ncbi:MAG: dGTPase [Paracoccaceae bacterium]
MRALPAPVIRFSPQMWADLNELRAFLFARMYRHWKVARMRRKAAFVVKELFAIFMDSPGVLPDDWRQQAQAEPDEAARARLVADYIAGMTDRFALTEHQHLTDPMARG